MVSTQTSLTCSRNDDLLPQSLLYNIISSKLAEAFQLTNLHAKICDYTDNLRSFKREPSEARYQFTSHYPDEPHLDLVLPAENEHKDPLIQGCYSPSTYIPRKRQRLQSDTLSPASAVRESVGLHFPPSLTCPNCKNTYKTLGGLNYHVKRCRNMVYHKPLTTACKQLSYEPDNPSFLSDVETENKSSSDKFENQILPDKSVLKSGDVEFVSEQSPGSDNVMVAYLVDNQKKGTSENTVKAVESAEEKLDCKNTEESECKNNEEKLECKNSEVKSECENTKDKSDPKEANDRAKDRAKYFGPLKATRSSNRVRSSNHRQRQVLTKLLLEKVKQSEIKRKTANKSCSKNKNNALKSQNSISGKAPSSSEESPAAMSRKLPAKRKKPVKLEENVDLKRNVKQKRNVKIEKEENMCIKVNPVVYVAPNSVEDSPDVKPSIPCTHCQCFFKSQWNLKRHEYRVHGIGTPLTSDDLASRQSGTECQECKGKSEHSVPANAAAGDSDTAWVCGVCGENLHSKVLLTQHRKVHDKQCPPVPQSQGMYVCQVCFKKYESSVSLLNHVNRQHNPTLTCSLCYKIFSSQTVLSEHSCSSDVKISCRHCPKTFTSHSEHLKHIRNAHASLTKSLNQSACKLCDYTFSSALKYRVHQTISHPTPELLCRLCNTTQTSRKELIQHIVIYHKTLPFLCTVCEKGFNKLEDLTKHRATHFQ